MYRVRVCDRAHKHYVTPELEVNVVLALNDTSSTLASQNEKKLPVTQEDDHSLFFAYHAPH